MSSQRRATKKQVLAVAARHGITITDTGDKIAVDLPRGYVLAGRDVHCTDLHYHSGGWPKPLAWGEILEDIEDGIEKCEIEDCAYCGDDEGWARQAQEDDDGDA